MKSKFLKVAFAGTILLSGLQATAQKANETSAALEYKKFNDIMMSGLMSGEVDFESAKKTIEKAKGYIDLAAENEATKESPKTLFYKGEIYFGYIMAFGTDTVFINENSDKYMETALAAYKKGYTLSPKFRQDTEQSINQKKMSFGTVINMMYDKKQFKEASEAYEVQVKLSDAVNQIDSSSIFNAAVCAEKAGDLNRAADFYMKTAEVGFKAPDIYAIASSALRKAGKKDQAKAILEKGKQKYPSEKSILLEMVNTAIDEGDNAGAEASLQAAIAKDPSNKQLWYTIGTIYIDLKQNDKAEQALNKALEIDPNYMDAQYQLGAFLLGVAGDISQEASRLKFGDAQYDVLMAKSDDYYKKALTPLENYIQKNPNDKTVLTILFQIHKNLKNTDKALEYKKRADAIK